jgi:CxxC-x17-CxxC domain-containing protein
MKNFKKDNRNGGKKDFERRDHGRSNFEHTMYKTTCYECGKSCEVPFKPSGDKPVYCSECFGNKERGGSNRGERKNFERSSYGEKQMYSAVCDECGKKCELPFKPSGDKPVYCSDCFRNKGADNSNRGGGGNKQYEEQLKAINTKLDKIIKALIPSDAPTVHIIEEKIEEKATKKKKEVKLKNETKKASTKKEAVKKKKK